MNRQRARADLDAATIGAAARDDVWWLPEVMRKRARYDDDADAVVRLAERDPARAITAQSALVRRCEADLAERTATTRASGAHVLNRSELVRVTTNAARTLRS